MQAKSDIENFDLTQIPLEAEKRVGRIFREGEIKYNRNNWRNGDNDKKYQLERANHALKHLKIFIHNLEHDEYLGEYKNGVPEDDLAKVMWFCCTQMELERLENLNVNSVEEEEEKTQEEEKIEVKEEKISILSRILKGN